MLEQVKRNNAIGSIEKYKALFGEEPPLDE